VPQRPLVGIGREPLLVDQFTQSELDQMNRQRAILTYGPARTHPLPDFIPAHVAFDKKVLRFNGYFRQDIEGSSENEYYVRPIVVYYYLEDDSISIVEPVVENSGIPQGKLVKRHQLPKNALGETYHWKDLNLRTDLIVYGTVYRLCDCDLFTRDFLESSGIIVNEPEEMPVDPYTQGRVQPLQSYNTPSDFDRLKQFLTMDRKVLRFFALWKNWDSLYSETRPVLLLYYLMDDTVEIREVHEPNSGRDPFPLLLRRQRVLKDYKELTDAFPSCVLEVSEQEVKEYYSPKDFKVGDTITMMGRKFFIYDCDQYTKNYYQEHLGEVPLKPVDISDKKTTDISKEIPPYNGFGSLEDSLQNCLSLIPQPPKKDFIKILENDHKILRYEAKLDSPNPEDHGRRFILSYYLSNDMISIFEPPVRNSGTIGGKFLEKTRIPKPDGTIDNPQYYGPSDLAIGSTIEVFGHWFRLTNADEYVLKFLEANAENIPLETLNSIRQVVKDNPIQLMNCSEKHLVQMSP
uniref:EF-hand domain (C-terminal) containing 1 n=1 Tax=Erpetoichthys calabaricus TaxID=27687 RepID=A0A8C4RTU1_ERPCA